MTLQLGPVIGKVGGAQLEEIPVSMSGGGNGTVHPLATVDAGDESFILVAGTMAPGRSAEPYRPHLQIGDYTIDDPHLHLTGPDGQVIGVRASGTVALAVRTRISNAAIFSGTVYVARM